MRKKKTITIGERQVDVNELTVAQVDALLNPVGGSAAREMSAAELLVDSVVPIEAVCASTGLSADEINATLAPSEAAALWAAVAEVNDFLSRMLERFAKVAEVARERSAPPPAA